MEVNVLTLAAIFFINLIYVTLNTLRMMLTMKGYRLSASLLSMVETVIWVYGLGLVMDNLNSILSIIMYALGFGVGIYVGIIIEDKLALGWGLTEAIVPEEGWQVAETLRENGYGVTVTEGHGKNGLRTILEILTPRSNEKDLYKLIRDVSPAAFIITHEPKYVNGGFWTKRVRKSRKSQNK